MFGSPQSGASVYAKLGMETSVAAADPHKLIVMLFEGAMVAVASAVQHMQAGDFEKKGAAISKAIMIIDAGLRASLNKEAGGNLALNLDSLYEYMSKRLLIANLKNQPKVLEEVYDLLKGLKGAWETIGSKPAESASQPSAAGAYSAAATSPSSLAKA
ncbi:flagellar export chaperone FliS [Noviherbaspirillum galbum]|uniref:Flagellar secretion chaperone FliS n=1 Tax=Noviherbaspirillum galbum TaxID=2709383 RepID=A0A6B3SPE4_9BURK|nr:flagellar export chaperone FliS [Noviherbaspirillum galbum]NEX62704.1 flagellar export chaperone FliS [Noviherbaspirillum galbum]